MGARLDQARDTQRRARDAVTLARTNVDRAIRNLEVAVLEESRASFDLGAAIGAADTEP